MSKNEQVEGFRDWLRGHCQHLDERVISASVFRTGDTAVVIMRDEAFRIAEEFDAMVPEYEEDDDAGC